ncbi:MAG: type II secretion system protein GspK, partial [Planctomycetota bacterium]
LLVVLIVVAISAMVAAGVMYRVGAEYKAASAAEARSQAYATAYSGVHKALAVAVAHADEPAVWLDNPELFENQLVYDDGAEQWYFSVYSPADPDADTVRFGLTDETGKVNLNVAGEDLLAELGLTGEMIDCLKDYTDPDDETRPLGAEQAAYDFTIRNHPSIWTIEELLLIHGFDGPVVYGEDVNFNGLLDANEDDGSLSFPPDDGNGQLDRGLRALATVASYEYDRDSAGRARKNVNADPRGMSGLPKQTVDFLAAWKEAKQPPLKHPAQLWGLEVEVTRKGPNGQERRERVPSGINADNLHVVLDKLTHLPRGGQMVRGRVNVNTAGAEVLAAAFRSVGADEQLADQIVQVRGEIPLEELGNIAWLASSGVVDDPETMTKIAPLLTTRSGQFRFFCVGFSIPSGRYCVLEAVIDLAGRSPRIAYLRDITRLGLPFGFDVEEIQY